MEKEIQYEVCYDVVATIKYIGTNNPDKDHYFEIGRHWYWHDTIKKSLWYPSVNIYISKKISDWTGAIEEVHQDILSEFNA